MFMLEFKNKFYQSFLRIFHEEGVALIGLEFKESISFKKIKRYISLIEKESY